MIGNISLIEMMARLSRALSDAPGQINGILYSIPEFKDLVTGDNNTVTAVHSHIQTASSTACGWGGIAGQAFTDFWITTLEFELLDVAAIYVGRLAYLCKMDDNYRSCIITQGLPLWDQSKNNKLEIIWRATK